MAELLAFTQAFYSALVTVKPLSVTESSVCSDVGTPTQVPPHSTDTGLEQQSGAHHAVSAESKLAGKGLLAK